MSEDYDVIIGTDPVTSVLDVDCKAHEVDNLHVVDPSIFPSIRAVNPALTAIADVLWPVSTWRTAWPEPTRG
jgi:choline dehydrogenase-like flavoprotein